MPRLSYSALDDGQRAQIAHLFADSLFGTDASLYEYEINNGVIVSRQATRPAPRTTTIKTVTVKTMEAAAEEHINHPMPISALSAIVINNLSQLEEVSA